MGGRGYALTDNIGMTEGRKDSAILISGTQNRKELASLELATAPGGQGWRIKGDKETSKTDKLASQQW